MGERISLPIASQRQIVAWLAKQREAAMEILIRAEGDDVIRWQQFIAACDALRSEVEREEREERQRGRRAAAANTA